MEYYPPQPPSDKVQVAEALDVPPAVAQLTPIPGNSFFQ